MNSLKMVKDIFFKRKIPAIISLVLIIAANIILFMVMRSIFAVYEGYTSLDELRSQEVYVGNDQSTDEQLQKLYGSEYYDQSNEKAKELFTYLNKNFNYAISWQMNSSDLSIGNSPITIKTINEDFTNFFPFQVKKGEMFSSENFDKSSEIIPIIIGASLEEKYPVGSELVAINPSNAEEETYKVIGILEDNTYTTSIYNLDSKIYLNYTVIRPLRNIDIANINIIQLTDGFQDLLIYGADNAKVNELESLIQKDDFFNIKFYSATQHIDSFFSMYKKRVIMMGSVGLFFLIITSILMIWNVTISYKILIKDIAIRALVGLSISKLRVSIILYQLLISLASILPVYIFALNMRLQIEKSSMSFFKTINNLGLAEMDLISIGILFIFLLGVNVISGLIINWYISKIPISLRVIE